MYGTAMATAAKAANESTILRMLRSPALTALGGGNALSRYQFPRRRPRKILRSLQPES
jgi:hypothetical protein